MYVYDSNGKKTAVKEHYDDSDSEVDNNDQDKESRSNRNMILGLILVGLVVGGIWWWMTSQKESHEGYASPSRTHRKASARKASPRATVRAGFGMDKRWGFRFY